MVIKSDDFIKWLRPIQRLPPKGEARRVSQKALNYPTERTEFEEVRHLF
jgi:hypothetical protein